MIVREEVITHYSDVTGKPVEKTVPIKIVQGRKTYVIDVDADNVAEELGNITIAQALEKGRVEKDAPATPRRARGSNSADAQRRKLHAAARSWAQAEGMDIGARGRVPDEIVEAYEESLKDSAQPAEKATVVDNTSADPWDEKEAAEADKS